MGKVWRKFSCPAAPRQPMNPDTSLSLPHQSGSLSPSPLGTSPRGSGSTSPSSSSSRTVFNWTALKSSLGLAGGTVSASVSPTATPLPQPSNENIRGRKMKNHPIFDTTPALVEMRQKRSTVEIGGNVNVEGFGVCGALQYVKRSPAADGKRRRSVRKQRYFGSVEMMVTVDSTGQVRNAGRFRVEPGADHSEPCVYQGETDLPTSPVMVENPEVETRWYFRHFLGREHQNFAGVDNQKSPFFLSAVMEDGTDGLRCRAILWKSTGSKKLIFPYTHGSSSSSGQTISAKEGGSNGSQSGSQIVGSSTLPQKPITARSIVQKFPGMTDLSHGMKEITDPKLQKDLLVLEEQEGAVSFKFGVIYAKHKQESDDEMLSNETGSHEFEQFLHLLGDQITLQGWSKFRGGLDAKTNSTGNQSVYTVYEGHEIMFHCSTMLPYSSGNKQQLERKRHIGNDIVNIIFEDEGDPTCPSFNPTAMKSQFTHIFAVITYDKNQGCYRLWVFSEETVPAYGPFLPTPNEFYDAQQFREFLLTKLINGEKAAFRSQVFAEKRYRTTDTLIKDMYIEYLKKEFSRGSLQKVTEAVIRHLRSPRSKEFDNNLVEFVRMGEHLKLTKSMSGEAPNVLAVSSLYRKQPWEPHLLCPDMPLYDSYSSDSWGNRSLVLATEGAGAIFVNEGVCTPLFEPACHVQQVNVLENFGLLIIRCDKGKDGYISVFSLSHMRACIRAGQTLQKKVCMEHRIPGTKGCQSYSVSGNNSLRLSIGVCFGKKLSLLRWNLGQITTSLTSSPEIVKHFYLIKEVSLSEEPLAMCLFESGLQANIKICSANKNGLDIIDFVDGSVKNLYRCPMAKTSITSLVASCDVESEDILLTLDHTTLLFDLCEEGTEPLAICWTASPQSVAYCFPFVLAFGMDTVEIRLAVNGNLFTYLYTPNARLLAAKEDIFFAVDRLDCPLSPSPNNNTGSPLTSKKQVVTETRSSGPSMPVSGISSPTTVHIIPPRRWAQLYKIPMKNLLTGGPRIGAGGDHGGAGAAGVPGMISSTGKGDENPSSAGGRNQSQGGSIDPTSNHQQYQHQYQKYVPSLRRLSPGVATELHPAPNQAALPSHMLVRNSVGSDSGWSSSQGRYSTASSLEVDGSSPPSPAAAGEWAGDVIL